MRPAPGTYPAYYERYLGYTDAADPLTALRASIKPVADLKVPSAKEDFAYAPGKWTVKELMLHISDAERVMAYRALRFARRDPQKTLPFDENAYAVASEAGRRSLASIIREIGIVREGTIALYEQLNDEQLLCKGMTGAGETTVLALGFMIAGHGLHHLQVLKERYL